MVGVRGGTVLAREIGPTDRGKFWQGKGTNGKKEERGTVTG